MVLDGAGYFSSKKIHCVKCSAATRNEEVAYSRSAITPVIAHPSQGEVLSLEPSFITPQDGHEKQDCELRAAGRWLVGSAVHYNLAGSILQGDDLYAKQPWCEQVTAAGYHYLFVCKPSSHKTLTEYLGLFPPEEFIDRVWHKGHYELRHYRFINGVPLRDGADALLVNWFEVTITQEKTGKRLFMNSYITDLEINSSDVAGLVSWGRCRWKIENENNNTLKTIGLQLRA